MNAPAGGAAARAPARPQAPAMRLRRALLASPASKPLVFVLALIPLGLLVWRALSMRLGANPEQAVIWTTGLWALRLLMLTLAVTPLRQLTGWNELARFRRMLGLFALFYVLLHFLGYFALVNDFSWRRVLDDAAVHPFVLAGFTAMTLMLPLAATSTQRMIRRLGAARWRALHRLVYLVGVLAVFHYWWGKLAKNNTADPKYYAALLALLLGWRVAYSLRRRLRRG